MSVKIPIIKLILNQSELRAFTAGRLVSLNPRLDVDGTSYLYMPWNTLNDKNTKYLLTLFALLIMQL